jgi:hypothetical protein
VTDARLLAASKLPARTFRRRGSPPQQVRPRCAEVETEMLRHAHLLAAGREPHVSRHGLALLFGHAHRPGERHSASRVYQYSRGNQVCSGGGGLWLVRTSGRTSAGASPATPRWEEVLRGLV